MGTPTDSQSPEEQLAWKSRLLKLRTKVLKLHLDKKAATLEACRATNRSIQSQLEARESKFDTTDHRTRLQCLQDKRNRLQYLKNQIFLRSQRMVRELWDVYPIQEFPDRKGYSICDIHLPSSELYEGHDEIMLSVAIGYVSHLILLLSDILDIALRFPLKYYGSKSFIYCNRKNQTFPLYIESSKSREWANFLYGMNLLNLNIVQLRSLYGLSTTEPDETLANLHSLKLALDS